MQLDRVRRDTRLAVLVVKERDTGHAGPRAEPYAAAGDADLTAPERRRPRVALGRGRLRDHVVAALLEHEVQVAVLLGRTSTTAATTVKTRRSNGRRVSGSELGAGRVMR